MKNLTTQQKNEILNELDGMGKLQIERYVSFLINSAQSLEAEKIANPTKMQELHNNKEIDNIIDDFNNEINFIIKQFHKKIA